MRARVERPDSTPTGLRSSCWSRISRCPASPLTRMEAEDLAAYIGSLRR